MLILSLTLFSSKSWVIFPCKMKMLVLPGLPEGWDNTHLLYQFMWVRRQSRYNFFSWSSSGSPTRLPRRCHPWLGSSEGLTGAKSACKCMCLSAKSHSCMAVGQRVLVSGWWGHSVPCHMSLSKMTALYSNFFKAKESLARKKYHVNPSKEWCLIMSAYWSGANHGSPQQGCDSPKTILEAAN